MLNKKNILIKMLLSTIVFLVTFFTMVSAIFYPDWESTWWNFSSYFDNFLWKTCEGNEILKWLTSDWNIICSKVPCRIGNWIWELDDNYECIVASCNSWFHIENNICVSDTMSCDVINWTWEKNWSNWSRWDCNLLACDSWFIQNWSSCEASLSCKSIYDTWWSYTDGVYTLVSDSWENYQAYCDMTNWWWTLVMKIKEWDTSLNYWSSYWTNTTTLNENDADISSDINMKNSAFSELAFSDIKFCMGTTDNCLLDNRSATSLKSLFSWASVNTSFSRSDFRTLFDNAWWWTTFSWMGNCNQSWYNKNSTSSSYYKCRFWIIFNNEGDCSSSDSSIWFWCSKSYWWRKYSCWWWHRYSERKKKWYIFIK